MLDAFEMHIAALRLLVREHAVRRGLLLNSSTDAEVLARYHDVLHELTRARRRITPAIRVLSNLTTIEEVDPECRIYLRDVLDHAEDVYDRLSSMLDDLRALRMEQQHALDARLQRSMGALTVISTIFLPAQFISSVFGMNFAIPGADTWYGFPLALSGMVCSWIIMFVALRRFRIV